MRYVQATVGPLAAASANAIAISQSVSAGGSVILTSAPYSLDKPRRVIITSAGNDATNVFVITGTNWSGSTITENLLGANAGVATSALSYAGLTSIVSTNATASTITVGTNGVADSNWVRLSEWSSPQCSIQTDVTGTVNYTLQQSIDDPNDPTNPVAASAMTWLAHPDSAAQNATGAIQTSYAYVPRWFRVLLNSGAGSVTAQIAQAGSVMS